MNNSDVVDRAISEVIKDFEVAPQRYFTEEDLRWRLMGQIERFLVEQGNLNVCLEDGATSAIHAEYPTPFRCSMANRTFTLLPPGTRAQRGHFDIVLLNASSAAHFRLEVVRSQYYQVFLQFLSKLPLPFLDCVIEVKLYRDLAHPNRTESPKQQAQYAVQAVNKVSAVLDAQPQYYLRPFAKRGIVFLADNSDLAYSGSVTNSRNYFKQSFEAALDWNSLPDTLSCIWVTPDEKRDYYGLRPPRNL